MFKLKMLLCISFLTSSIIAVAGDRLVLDFDLENDVLSLSHNIDQFLFVPTRNYVGESKINVNDMSSPLLKDHLAATGLVRINDKVVGFVTEQEVLFTDPDTQMPMAESMWMFRLNTPGLTGFMSVLQKEDASKIFSLVQEVHNDQDKKWADDWQMFLSTVGKTRVQFASGELSKYQGGIFEEYNGLNPGDFASLGRFRGRIQFVIYPREQPPLMRSGGSTIEQSR